MENTNSVQNAFLLKETRQRIKLMGKNFDHLFPKTIIKQIFKTLEPEKTSIEEFELLLLSTTHAYFDIKAIKEDRHSAVISAKKFEQIASAIKWVRIQLKTLDEKEQKQFLQMLNQINRPGTLQSRFRDKIMATDYLASDTVSKIVVDPKSFFAGLQWLHLSAERISKVGQIPLPNGAPMKLARKDSNDHINTLIRSAREYWVRTQNRLFTLDYHARESTLLTPAALFCAEIAKHLDPAIRPTQINSAMKLVITYTNRKRSTRK